MVGGRAAWRVPIVVRPLDWFFTLTKFVAVPVTVVVLAAPTLNALGWGEKTGGWLGAVVLALVCVGVLQTPQVAQHVNRLSALARRRIALSCNHDYRSAHREGLTCRLTAEAFRVPLFRYEAQKAAVTALAAACDADTHGQYWFVEGTSGSGKTRTALLLVQTLIRSVQHVELGSRCQLYDFADAAGVQDQLLGRLGSPRHDNLVVLVDNFQLVRADVLRVITDRLVGRAGRTPERLVVFLARPGDAWNLSPGADVRILSEAKEAQHHLRLTGPSAEEVVSRVRALDSVAATHLSVLSGGLVATAAQLHLAQIIVRNSGVPDDVHDVLRLLAGETGGAHDDLLRALGTVAAMTVHRGAFRRRELGALVSRAAGQRRRAAFEARRDLRRLHRVGLVTKLTVGETRFVFHEAITEECVDRLTGLPSFDEAFRRVAAERVTVLQQEDEPLGAWLVGTEIGEQDVLAKTFDGAMSTGAYARMTHCLRRAAVRYPLEDTSQLQLAILFDRTGDFAASREVIGAASPAAAGVGRLGAMLIAQRIEAGHDARSLQDAATLRSNSDPEVALVGEYWELHIAAHRGNFAPERLLELATQMLELHADRDDYWTAYAMSRMHFDSLRHHYLTGGRPVDALVAPSRRELDAVLSRHLPFFEAQHVLYGKAHLVGHVLLPRLALLGEVVPSDYATLAEIGDEDTRSFDALAAAAERLYSRARDGFWKFGDREAEYLQADVLNARMIQTGVDLDRFASDLHTYEQYIEKTGFADIRSYPQLYYARWHVLRHFAALATPGAASPTAGSTAELDQAARRLERAITYDTAVENAYGLHRAELLSLLLRSLTQIQPFDIDEALALGDRMRTRRYNFEAELLTRLTEMGRVPISTLFAAFRYYPIVHQ